VKAAEKVSDVRSAYVTGTLLPPPGAAAAAAAASEAAEAAEAAAATDAETKTTAAKQKAAAATAAATATAKQKAASAAAAAAAAAARSRSGSSASTRIALVEGAETTDTLAAKGDKGDKGDKGEKGETGERALAWDPPSSAQPKDEDTAPQSPSSAEKYMGRVEGEVARLQGEAEAQRIAGLERKLEKMRARLDAGVALAMGGAAFLLPSNKSLASGSGGSGGSGGAGGDVPHGGAGGSGGRDGGRGSGDGSCGDGVDIGGGGVVRKLSLAPAAAAVGAVPVTEPPLPPQGDLASRLGSIESEISKLRQHIAEAAAARLVGDMPADLFVAGAGAGIELASGTSEEAGLTAAAVLSAEQKVADLEVLEGELGTVELGRPARSPDSPGAWIRPGEADVSSSAWNMHGGTRVVYGSPGRSAGARDTRLLDPPVSPSPSTAWEAGYLPHGAAAAAAAAAAAGRGGVGWASSFGSPVVTKLEASVRNGAAAAAAAGYLPHGAAAATAAAGAAGRGGVAWASSFGPPVVFEFPTPAPAPAPAAARRSPLALSVRTSADPDTSMAKEMAAAAAAKEVGTSALPSSSSFTFGPPCRA